MVDKDTFQIRSKNPLNYSYVINSGSLAKHLIYHFATMSTSKKKWTKKIMYLNYILYHSVDSFLEISYVLDTSYKLLNTKEQDVLMKKSNELNMGNVFKETKYLIGFDDGYDIAMLFIYDRVFDIKSRLTKKDAYFSLSYKGIILFEIDEINNKTYIRNDKLEFLVEDNNI